MGVFIFTKCIIWCMLALLLPTLNSACFVCGMNQVGLFYSVLCVLFVILQEFIWNS